MSKDSPRFSSELPFKDHYRAAFDASDGPEKAMWAIAIELNELRYALGSNDNGDGLADEVHAVAGALYDDREDGLTAKVDQVREEVVGAGVAIVDALKGVGR